MTSDQESLLATIAARPDDDLPRLVYADWLDERGANADVARAAFIREQIREWRNPEPWELSQAPRPSAAIAEQYRDTWLAALPEKQRPWVQFERGFVETLRPVKVRTGFLPLLEKPAGELATVRRLVIPGGNGMRGADYARIAASPGLARLRELVTEDNVQGPAVAVILASPHLTQLESLRCLGQVYNPWAVLAAPPPAPLRRLTLTPCGWTVVGMRNGIELDDIERSTLLRGLAELELRGQGTYMPDALGAICRGACLPQVERLAFALATGGPENIDPRIIGRMDLPRLRHLTVYYNGDADRLADALASNPRADRLEGFALNNSPLSLDALSRFVDSYALPGLKRLDVQVRGTPKPLCNYLLASDAPLRLDKLFVGWRRFNNRCGRRLKAKYGPRLQPHTDSQLDATLRRLGRA